MRIWRVSERSPNTGLFSRLVAAIRRRLPRLKRFVVFSGPVTDEFAGAMADRGARLVEVTRDSAEGAPAFRKEEVVEHMKTWLERGTRGWFAVRDGLDFEGSVLVLEAWGRSLMRPTRGSSISR